MLVFSSPTANIGAPLEIHTPWCKMQHVDGRDGPVRADQVRREAEDVAVDRRLELVRLEVDRVLPRLDRDRPELVVEMLHLRGGRRRPDEQGDEEGEHRATKGAAHRTSSRISAATHSASPTWIDGTPATWIENSAMRRVSLRTACSRTGSPNSSATGPAASATTSRPP